MATIEQVTFATDDWKLIETTDSVITWQNDVPDELTLNFFPIPPDIAVPLERVDDLRQFYKELLNHHHGGLVLLEIVSLSAVPAIKQIVKMPMPQQQHGLVYLASYTIPFANFSYVVKVQCNEWGTTGIRETFVTAMAVKAGRVKIEGGNIKGWIPDPRLDKNLSEDEQYDAQFPQNPLSRARHYLATIEETLKIDEDIIKAPKFLGPPTKQNRFMNRFKGNS